LLFITKQNADLSQITQISTDEILNFCNIYSVVKLNLNYFCVNLCNLRENFLIYSFMLREIVFIIFRIMNRGLPLEILSYVVGKNFLSDESVFDLSQITQISTDEILNFCNIYSVVKLNLNYFCVNLCNL